MSLVCKLLKPKLTDGLKFRPDDGEDVKSDYNLSKKWRWTGLNLVSTILNLLTTRWSVLTSTSSSLLTCNSTNQCVLSSSWYFTKNHFAGFISTLKWIHSTNLWAAGLREHDPNVSGFSGCPFLMCYSPFPPSLCSTKTNQQLLSFIKPQSLLSCNQPQHTPWQASMK